MLVDNIRADTYMNRYWYPILISCSKDTYIFMRKIIFLYHFAYCFSKT